MDTAASSGFSFQSSSGQGFAIPIDEVVTVAAAIEHGTSTSTIHIGATALIGVGVEVGAPYGNGYGYGAGYGSANQTSGAFVSYVANGSPAAAAGIVAGDTITSLGGHAVSSATALTNAKDRLHPGDRVRLTWMDGSGTSHTATITLASGPAA
jgi:S1-C subfamily serine protease